VLSSCRCRREVRAPLQQAPLPFLIRRPVAGGYGGKHGQALAIVAEAAVPLDDVGVPEAVPRTHARNVGKSREQNLDPGGLDTEGALAAEAAAEAFLGHEFARMKQRLSRYGLEPEPWRKATLVLGATTWMTAEELLDISDQLKRLLVTHEERAADPRLRPPGAREVRLFAATSVAPPVTPTHDAEPGA
jgi:hypothetical protein